MTPAQIIDNVASLMNDTAQTQYTDAACLPYLNMTLEKLMQRMEENNIPITTQTISPSISVLAGATKIDVLGPSFLPTDFLEPLELWESNDGGNSWTQIVRMVNIDPNIAENQNISSFGIYVWSGTELQFPEATSDILVKIQYLRKIITIPLVIGGINLPLGIRNFDQFLWFETAALCSMFIGENETRALALHSLADDALATEMNIPNKSQQNITTRRRPFRAAYKSVGRMS